MLLRSSIDDRSGVNCKAVYTIPYHSMNITPLHATSSYSLNVTPLNSRPCFGVSITPHATLYPIIWHFQGFNSALQRVPPAPDDGPCMRPCNCISNAGSLFSFRSDSPNISTPIAVRFTSPKTTIQIEFSAPLPRYLPQRILRYRRRSSPKRAASKVRIIDISSFRVLELIASLVRSNDSSHWVKKLEGRYDFER